MSMPETVVDKLAYVLGAGIGMLFLFIFIGLPLAVYTGVWAGICVRAFRWMVSE